MQTFLLLLAASSSLVSASPDKVVGCYFTNSEDGKGASAYSVKNIDPTLCSHIFYSFVGPSEDGTVRILDPKKDIEHEGLANFVALREKSPSTKFMISMGGWGITSQNFSALVTDPKSRSTFAQNIFDFVKNYKFDGFDLDWEYPSERLGEETDKENLILFLKELKQLFEKEKFILTMAVSPFEVHIPYSYDIPGLSKYLDYLNFMTYEFYSFDPVDNHVGHNSPLYPSRKEDPDRQTMNIDYCVNTWINQGAPPEKIIVGTAFYGKSYTLENPKIVGRGAPYVGPGNRGKYSTDNGTLSYLEVCSLIKENGWKRIYDPEQRVPYAYKGDQLVAYDDAESLAEKAYYVNENKLGGVMMWAMDLDDFIGECGEKNILLKTLNRVLRSSKFLKDSYEKLI